MRKVNQTVYFLAIYYSSPAIFCKGFLFLICNLFYLDKFFGTLYYKLSSVLAAIIQKGVLFMKRFLTLLFTTLLLTAALCVNASASHFDAAAEDLSAIGMFRGTENGFELDRAPTRSEAAIMLVRLYGAEDAAKTAYEAGEIQHPFTDVSDFTSPYVAWLYTNGITNGYTETTFASQRPCSAQNYAVFLLRALGYKDGTDFEYTDATEFAVTKGLFDLSFFAGDFLRDDLAAVTYQALACKLSDGSDTLIGSLIASGAIAAQAAKPITDKLTAYRELIASTGTALQDSLDADLSMKMDLVMDMTMPDPETGKAVTEQVAADIAMDGTVQMILDPDDIQMGMNLDLVLNMAMDDPETGAAMNVSQPMTMGFWMKDNWMYVSDGTTSYKQDMSGTMGEFMAVYEELLGQIAEMSDMSTAMMMPYIDGVTTKRSGGDTIYTLDINDAAYNGLMADIFDLIFEELGAEDAAALPLSMTMSLDEYDCSYTVGRKGLKAMDAVLSMTLAMDMSDPVSGSISLTAKADLEMDMTANATGSSVKVDYPDLSTFRDYEEILAEAMESIPTVDDSASFANR